MAIGASYRWYQYILIVLIRDKVVTGVSGVGCCLRQRSLIRAQGVARADVTGVKKKGSSRWVPRPSVMLALVMLLLESAV